MTIRAKPFVILGIWTTDSSNSCHACGVKMVGADALKLAGLTAVGEIGATATGVLMRWKSADEPFSLGARGEKVGIASDEVCGAGPGDSTMSPSTSILTLLLKSGSVGTAVLSSKESSGDEKATCRIFSEGVGYSHFCLRLALQQFEHRGAWSPACVQLLVRTLESCRSSHLHRRCLSRHGILQPC